MDDQNQQKQDKEPEVNRSDAAIEDLEPSGADAEEVTGGDGKLPYVTYSMSDILISN